MLFNLKLFYCFWLKFLAKFLIKDTFFNIVLSVRMHWNSLVPGARPRTPLGGAKARHPRPPQPTGRGAAHPENMWCHFNAYLHTRPRNRKSCLRTPHPKNFPPAHVWLCFIGNICSHWFLIECLFKYFKFYEKAHYAFASYWFYCKILWTTLLCGLII